MIDAWKQELLLERIRELRAIYCTQFDHTAWRVDEALDEAVALLRHLDEAERQYERAEHVLLVERRRRHERRAMYDRFERWQMRIPPIHACSQETVHTCLEQMRDAIRNDDPAEFDRLAAEIRECVAQELRFEAENCESVGFFKDAWRLRRQAERFEASYV